MNNWKERKSQGCTTDVTDGHVFKTWKKNSKKKILSNHKRSVDDCFPPSLTLFSSSIVMCIDDIYAQLNCLLNRNVIVEQIFKNLEVFPEKLNYHKMNGIFQDW